MYKRVFVWFILLSFSSFASDKFYTPEEIQAAKDQGVSPLTLTDLHVEGKKTWFSLTEENCNYKGNAQQNYVLVRMDDQLLNNGWVGDIALFPFTHTSLSEVYKTCLGFSDFWGTEFTSVISFRYCPRDSSSNEQPYVILTKSITPSSQRGRGYNQFTRKCFVDFVRKHTDAELIFSDAHNPISRHILIKSEFGFQDAKNEQSLAYYTKGMAVPYYLRINR